MKTQLRDHSSILVHVCGSILQHSHHEHQAEESDSLQRTEYFVLANAMSRIKYNNNHELSKYALIYSVGMA